MGSPRFLFSIPTLLVGLFFPLFTTQLAFSQNGPIVTATYEGIINPVAAEYLHEAIDYADQQKAQLLVFQLDTPG